MRVDLNQMRFTPTSEGDDLVVSHIELIIRNLLEAGMSDFTLVVVGSFGRGEGVLVKNQAGKYVVINDYDFLVYRPHGCAYWERKLLRKLSKSLRSELNVWHLDLIPISSEQITAATKTMMLYDTRYGGQVVYGDPSLLQAIPIEEDGSLPHSETLNLLINRLVTLYEGHPKTLTKMSLTYKIRQLAKVWYALVDTILAERGEYQTRYTDKLTALKATESNAKTEQLLEWAEFAAKARVCKLDEDLLTEEFITKHWQSLSDLLRAEIFRLTKRVSGKEITTMSELVDEWRGGQKQSVFSILIKLATFRKDKQSIEQQMYLGLDESRSAGFAARAEKFVRDWYRAA